MDQNRFDKLAVSLAEAGSSRRSILARLAASGFAAALATLGIGGFSAEDADAKKKKDKCAKNCKKKNSKQARRQCRKKCDKPNHTSISITNSQAPAGGTCTVGSNAGCPAGFTCLAGPAGLFICQSNPTTPVGGCTSNSQCSSGRCDTGSHTCVVCPTICGTPGAPICCTLGTQCLTNPGGSLVCL